MSEPSLSVLERLETLPDWDKVVACSGTGHYTGMDKHLHGDPSQPAEWMMKHRCPSCGHSNTRPVCDFFKNHGLDPDRMVACTGCHKRESAALFFTILHRL
jgi:hypothetical protein